MSTTIRATVSPTATVEAFVYSPLTKRKQLTRTRQALVTAVQAAAGTVQDLSATSWLAQPIRSCCCSKLRLFKAHQSHMIVVVHLVRAQPICTRGTMVPTAISQAVTFAPFLATRVLPLQAAPLPPVPRRAQLSQPP